MNDTALKSYRRHTLRVMLIIFMVGSGILFLSISVFSIFYVKHAAFSLAVYPFPKAFVLSTISILFSGLFFYKARENFEHGILISLYRYLILALILSMVFIAFQIDGWARMLSYTNDIGSKNLVSFVLALSGIHAIHLLGGLIFLIWMIFSVKMARKDDVKGLMFTTEPYTKARLATLSLYWLYLEIIWVLQFLLFYLVYW
ncbi:MAG: hypothetical protein JXQ87_00610 [Bacteroidia bacterium]